MLIMSFMLGEAGISCLEMPGEAMNLNKIYTTFHNSIFAKVNNTFCGSFFFKL
jgi:hypothetical protein